MSYLNLDTYKKCRKLLGEKSWTMLLNQYDSSIGFNSFYKFACNVLDADELPPFLPELADLELLLSQTLKLPIDQNIDLNKLAVNPTLSIFQSKWELTTLFSLDFSNSLKPPINRDQCILVWRDYKHGIIKIKEGLARDLLSIKIATEDLLIEDAAKEAGLSNYLISDIIMASIRKGFIFGPSSKISRKRKAISNCHSNSMHTIEQKVSRFTLQWHITDNCDLRCSHCYIDNREVDISLKQAISVIDNFGKFCGAKNVTGQINFSGGNPLLHSDFIEIYGNAATFGFELAIMGNPTSYDKILEIIKVKKPLYYQLSLEGLSEYNDSVRGKGNFKKVIEFMEILNEMKIACGVMLTLTDKNLEQIIPLSEFLKNHCSGFAFCRLSKTGNGCNFNSPSKKELAEFFSKYIDANNDGFLKNKDNLLSIPLLDKFMKNDGGCTGYGCGAAFNFVALLTNGDVYACRKFPSTLGNIFNEDLVEIYDSPLAARYREGSKSCGSCKLQSNCGGCMASTYNYGLDIFNDKDPDCFL